MAGSCVEKLPHSCGTSDALQVFVEDDKFSAYCFACSTYVPNPYEDKPDGYIPEFSEKSPEQIEAELAEIDTYPTATLHSRRLRCEYLQYFQVKLAMAQEDGITPRGAYFPYCRGGALSGYKVRLLDHKKMWSMGNMRDVDLFGWQQALATGAKTLYITEGEFDAVALFQAIKSTQKPEYQDFNPAVVSLTKGAGGVRKDLTSVSKDIRENFKEVVLVFDQDAAGNKAVEEAMQILPYAQSVTLPANDPNECLIKGFKKGLVNAVLFKRNKPKNSRIINASSLFEAAMEAPQMGLSWPWEGLTKLTRGIRMGETYYIGAGVKMGKSELVNSLAVHLMVEHDLNVFMAKPEEANKKTVKMVAGKIAGKFFHDPDKEYDKDAYLKAVSKVGDKLILLSIYQHLGWSTLRSDIIEAVESGAKAVFIDPITNLINGVPAAQANTVLQEISQDLAALAKDLEIVVFIFCHLKAPESGDSHERGGPVLSHQFSGSRAMMRSCNLMLGLEGNKDPNITQEERNMRKLVVLEDRECG